MKQVPYQGPTDIRRQRTKFSLLGFVHPWYMDLELHISKPVLKTSMPLPGINP